MIGLHLSNSFIFEQLYLILCFQIFLISTFLLSVYKNGIKVLILNTVILLNSFIQVFFKLQISWIFYVDSHIVYQSKQFYFFFSSLFGFYLLFMPCYNGYNIHNILNKNVKRQPSCLASDIRGKDFQSFTIKNDAM